MNFEVFGYTKEGSREDNEICVCSLLEKERASRRILPSPLSAFSSPDDEVRSGEHRWCWVQGVGRAEPPLAG